MESPCIYNNADSSYMYSLPILNNLTFVPNFYVRTSKLKWLLLFSVIIDLDKMAVKDR